MPLNGEYMATMMKIASDAARAHTISVTITVALDGLKPTRCGHGRAASAAKPYGLSLEQLLTRILKILF